MTPLETRCTQIGFNFTSVLVWSYGNGIYGMDKVVHKFGLTYISRHTGYTARNTLKKYRTFERRDKFEFGPFFRTVVH